jgi:pimeloyl-ACP methyl ester carboxylesterase
MERSYADPLLSAGIRFRTVAAVNGLDMHILEAGDPAHPTVLLLHGFPELAYSWRALMPLIAARGYHVVAPDQRGYGKTLGWNGSYDGDLSPFRLTHLAADVIALADRLSIGRLAVVGHDFGSPVAAWAALLYPRRFACVALMSAPFPGPPRAAAGIWRNLDASLSALDPPRKHYQRYFATRTAESDMLASPQGLAAFLRAYFHCKSHDWSGNQPHRLASWDATELAKMPRYYIMDIDRDMPATAATMAPTAQAAAACKWLTDSELAVYTQEFSRTGFQGGLNWYRTAFDADSQEELGRHAGKRIEIPAAFFAGASDWGSYQSPGAIEAMHAACPNMQEDTFIAAAGHWVQQEQPELLADALCPFIARHLPPLKASGP